MTKIRSFFTKPIVALILILLLAAAFRLYRLNEAAQFRHDEARDMLAERQMIVDKRLTMLGPDSRIGDKTIYFGPLHYYLMTPALVVSRFDPMGPYFWTAILGVATTLIIFLMTRSLAAAAFFAVFPVAVIYNRSAWNPNTIPFFTALSFWAFLRKRYFWAGLFWGLAIQLHITVLAFGAVALIFLVIDRESIIRGLLFLVSGLVIGLSPMIIFDLRHEGFYLTAYKTLTDAEFAYRGFNWHYFLWFLPVAAWLVSKLNRRVAAGIVGISLVASAYWLGNLHVVDEVHPDRIKQISAIISADHQSRRDRLFNVASFVDPVARATAYRYFLSLGNTIPLEVDQYPVADDLYVVTFETGDKVLYNKTYEVASFQPKTVAQTWVIGNEYLYRLER